MIGRDQVRPAVPVQVPERQAPRPDPGPECDVRVKTSVARAREHGHKITSDSGDVGNGITVQVPDYDPAAAPQGRRDPRRLERPVPPPAQGVESVVPDHDKVEMPVAIEVLQPHVKCKSAVGKNGDQHERPALTTEDRNAAFDTISGHGIEQAIAVEIAEGDRRRVCPNAHRNWCGERAVSAPRVDREPPPRAIHHYQIGDAVSRYVSDVEIARLTLDGHDRRRSE